MAHPIISGCAVNTEYIYEVTNVELLPSEESSSSNGVGSTPSKSIEVLYPLAKLLQNVEKSYDKDKKKYDEFVQANKIEVEGAQGDEDSDVSYRDVYHGTGSEFDNKEEEAEKN